MNEPQAAIAKTLEELERAARFLRKAHGKQVRGAEERQYLRAVAYSWFQSHRPVVAAAAGSDAVLAIDTCYRVVLDSAEKFASRTTYSAALRSSKRALVELRGSLLSGVQSSV